MSHNLVVSKAFGKYKAGQTITDKAEIAKIVGSSKMHNVVRVFAKATHATPAPAAEAPVAPAPAAEPAPAEQAAEPAAEPAAEA